MEKIKYQVGDRVNVKEEYPEIIKALTESFAMAQEMMETAASLKLNANAEFWATFHGLFPGGEHLSWRVNPNNGECLATSTMEALIAKKKIEMGL